MPDPTNKSPSRRGEVTAKVIDFLSKRRGEWWKTPEISERLYEDYYKPDYKNEKSFRRTLSEVKSILSRDDSIQIEKAGSRGSIHTHRWRKKPPECDVCGERMELAEEPEDKDFRFLCKNNGCEGTA